MLRNDYLMRLIEQFTQAIALILGFKKAKEYKKSLTAIQDTVQQIFGVDAKFIDTIPEEDLLILLKVDGNIDPDRAVMIAALQRITGEIYEAQKELDLSYFAYLKSLTLYLEVFNHDGDTLLSDYLSEIEPLIGKLEHYELPCRTKHRLWRYYEKTGNYAKAEDLLYELIEADERESDILGQGVGFYERLLTKTDPELNAGNLPREEVEEGLTKWRKLTQEASW
jgi:tetratricopeptide (TPR) repeat protein